MEDVEAPPGFRPPSPTPASDRPRSRRSIALAAVVGAAVVVGLTFVLADVTAGAPSADESAAQSTEEQVERGAALFQYGCTSCHGTGGVGTDKGPSLIGVGAAAADFQLSTGRMPLASPDARSVRKAPGYSPSTIDDLVAYVASLGAGPRIPNVDLTGADLAAGGVAYRANCAACHNAAGSGGALSYGQSAPNLFDATPTQIVEAMRTGPGQMPVFGTKELNQDDENNIALYITQTLQHADNRGGLPLGSTGPVPEGLLAGVVGLVVIGAALRWTVRSRNE